METKKLTTRKIVFVALMAALTAVGSALRITIPLDLGSGTTSFHLGNIMCALSGLLFGPWLGGLAAGLGSAIYDMTNPLYISECWITFLMKGAYGLVAGLVAYSGKKEWGMGKATAATTAAAVTYAVLYMLKSFIKNMVVKGLPAAGAFVALSGKVPATIFNAVVAIVLAPVLAIAIRKALKTNHLTLE